MGTHGKAQHNPLLSNSTIAKETNSSFCNADWWLKRKMGAGKARKGMRYPNCTISLTNSGASRLVSQNVECSFSLPCTVTIVDLSAAAAMDLWAHVLKLIIWESMEVSREWQVNSTIWNTTMKCIPIHSRLLHYTWLPVLLLCSLFRTSTRFTLQHWTWFPKMAHSPAEKTRPKTLDHRDSYRWAGGGLLVGC